MGSRFHRRTRRRGSRHAQIITITCHSLQCAVHAVIIAMLSCYALSCLVSAVKKTLLRPDLAVRLDGDLIVGLEDGDGVVGDLGTAWC